MLRINSNFSPDSTKKYFCEAYYKEGLQLQHSYYSDHNEAIGMWGGKAAARLGLTGDISKEDFAKLCDNINPLTGHTLTQRNDKDRIVGYDFTFNTTKSVSLAYAFGNDNDKREILSALHYAVRQTMLEVERDMQTRIRAKGKNENRLTGNIAYGEFTHFTTRPVEGMPDPHLHAHCFVFNATYDQEEHKWKAAKFRQLKQDAPYYEAVFHSKLADKLQCLGYGIAKTKNAFEIIGVEKETNDKFSRRTKEIEEYSQEHNITDDKQKSKLGAKTREAKRTDITPEQQEADWLGRLTPSELSTLKNLRNSNGGGFVPLSPNAAEKALQFSLNHHLERKSVVTDKEILATAIKSSVGKTSTEQVVKAFTDNENVITAFDELRLMVTTKEALQEEKQLIVNGRQSKNIFRPINANYEPKNERLNDQQKAAVTHALSSTDGISVIGGKAGVGKTTLMKEVQAGIHAANKQIFAFAPSSDASRNVQRNEGFKNADTVAMLLLDKNLQAQLKHQVIWVDEAGMLSNKDMNGILAVAKQQSARVILSGDTKQHNSVERGDALRILIKEAGIKPVTVSKIQRQKDPKYKEAVKLLASGQVEKGFKQLENIRAIAEITDNTERLKTIADDYYTSTYSGDKKPNAVLVIAPTHAEGEAVTEHIRLKLKEKNIINQDDKEYICLKNLQLTNAEKQKTDSYQSGQVIICHQNIKGIKAGKRLEVTTATEKGIEVKDSANKLYVIPYDRSSRFNVYEAKALAVSKGDKIRITTNAKTNDDVHLFNGSTYTITGFDKSGNIKLSNGSAIAKDFGHFNLGYVATSHSSQGKTADKVIISQSSATFRASSMEQFYVSVSRSEFAVSIYTDSKDDLKHAISQSVQRMSATELLKKATSQAQENMRVQKQLHNTTHKINSYGFSQDNRTR